MNKNDIIEHITKQRDKYKGWWYHAAIQAMSQGHYYLIDSRQEPGVYLARFWLSKPKPGQHDKWSSGNSSLLHWILKADDEDALHTHPWHFRTQILSGGYDEHLPPADWVRGKFGPGPGITKKHVAGDVVYRKLNQLHCVKNVLPDTWTLVTTGPKKIDWGFHPEGQEWEYYRDYLGLNKEK